VEAFFDAVAASLPNIVLAACVLVGVIGSIVPALPGPALVLAGALIHGVWTGFSPLSWPFQLALVVLTAAALASQHAVSALGARRFGSGAWGIGGATVGLLLGTLFIPLPLFGSLFGAFLGALSGELLAARRAQRENPDAASPDVKQAARAGAGAVVGAVLGLAAQFGLTLVMVGTIGWAFLRG
jgi:uncharacterized protein YqgC (DUF456 family)